MSSICKEETSKGGGYSIFEGSKLHAYCCASLHLHCTFATRRSIQLFRTSDRLSSALCVGWQTYISNLPLLTSLAEPSRRGRGNIKATKSPAGRTHFRLDKMAEATAAYRAGLTK